MSTINKQYRDIHDYNGGILQNFGLEQLATDPTGLVKPRTWFNTTSQRVKYFDGTTTHSLAKLEDLNKLGTLVGGLDASAGLPTTGLDSSGNGDADIKAEDYWRVTTAGTISGLASGDEALEVGDVLKALIDNATLPAHFFAIQANVDLTALEINQTLASQGITEDVEYTLPFTTLGVVNDIKIKDANGNDITNGLNINGLGTTTVKIQGNTTLTNLTITGFGVAI